MELKYRAIVRLLTLPAAAADAAIAEAPVQGLRRYKGVALTSAAAEALAQRRALLVRRLASRDAREREVLLARMSDLSRRANAMGRIAIARARQRHVANLEWARARDPHRLAEVMRASRDGYFSGSPGLPPDCESAYTNHYRELCTGADITPPSVADPAWDAFKPMLGASRPADWVRYDELDVYLALHGVDAYAANELRRRGGHTSACSAGCTVCSGVIAQADAHAADPSVPLPEWKPKLKTSRAAGPDGVTAEALKWFRSADNAADTLECRVKICKLVAGLLNDIIDGAAPPGFLDVNVTAVPKGNFVPGNPDTTRPVSVHNSLSKISEIIADTRLLHALVTDGVISEVQAGFMPGRSCEQHVFVLKEVVKHRWRTGQSTYAAFVDARKAYDSTSPSALWSLLARLGAPARLLDHLKASYAARRQRFTFNGVVTDEWTQRNGLSTGSVLSPLLFNIFIDCLARYIAADVSVPGVTVSSAAESVTVKCGLLADDVHVISSDLDGLRRALARVQEWATANGITLAIGVTKTAAMFFAAVPSAGVPVALDIGNGVAVPFTREYKFLGHRLTVDLDRSGERHDILGKMRASLSSFMGDDVIRSCSIAFQAGIYKAAVLGAATHLLSMTEPSIALVNDVDRINATAAAYILRTSPKERGFRRTGATEVNVISGVHLLTREHNRFFFATRRGATVATTLAAVFRVVHDSDAGIAARRGHSTQCGFPPSHRSWFVGFYSLHVRNGGSRRENLLAAPDQGPRWGVHAIVSGIARRAAHAQWRAAHLAYLRKTGGVEVRDAKYVNTVSAKPLRYLLDRYFHLPDALPDLAEGMTRLSAYGAGGSSVLGTSRASVSDAIAVHRSRLGRAGLFCPPFWRAPRGAPPLGPDAFRAVYSATACNLCGGDGGDAVHFATTCAHAVMADRRNAAITGTWRGAVGALAKALAVATGGNDPPGDFTIALGSLAPESPEGAFVIGNWLTAVAWTRVSVPDDWVVAARLGRYFDRTVPAASLAKVCTVWVTGAGRALRTLCTDWPFLVGPRQLRRLVRSGFRLPPPAWVLGAPI